MAKHGFLQKAKLKVAPENAGCAVINFNLSPCQLNEARGYRWRRRVSRRGGACAKVREAQVGDAAACRALHCDKKATLNKKTTF
jgi:hypothetical protein